MFSIRATILQTPGPDRFELLVDRVVSVGDDGRIVSVEAAGPTASGADAADAVLDDGVVLVPGMIDTHLHAPQWPQLGVGLDLPLERWLFEHTFPLEARFADVSFAEQVWADLVSGLLRQGTTTAVYYSSIHEPATTALAQACVEHGQRALVGRVAMDHPDGTPAWYRDASASEAVAASARSIDEIRAIDDPVDLVAPIITPRFVPACTDAGLAGLGELAAATGVRIQTHCSESDWEHRHVLERHGTTDAHALERFGLLRAHTVLAHATHLTDDDRALLARTGAGVAHCPLSNVYFANRPFGARRALDARVPVGLGTDVAGGPSPSLFAQCSHAVAASQQLVDRGDPAARIDIPTAFWMATAGGAELLGIDAGLLAPGRHFDALAVRTPTVARFDHEDVGDVGDVDRSRADLLGERLVRLVEASDIERVWVAGHDVTPAPNRAPY